MEREQYIAMLKQCDDPENWEVPGGWKNYDYAANESRFKELANDIVAILGPGCEIETGAEIQDASFIGQVLGPPSQPDGERTVVRASHFGRMVTIFGESELDVKIAEKLKQKFIEQGYVFIPEEVLDEPYTGQNRGVTGICDWRIRYFDWV